MNIIDQIYLQNPWYRDRGFIPRQHFLPKRKIFGSFLRETKTTKQIISLTGLRRVGKSTLLKQIVAHLLVDRYPPAYILYFSFDQPTIMEDTRTLESLIQTYFEKIVRKSIHRLTEKVYIFLDEVQLVPYWQDIVKRYYDLNQNIKFIVSGSSSLFIKEKARESLAGRIFERCLPPLCFSEYKKFSKSADFISYLNYGQFPELLQIKDISRKIEYLKEGVIGKILAVDIVKLYGIRKTLEFERLFWSLLPNTGQVIRSARLMSDLGMKKATLFKYLGILEKSLLIHKILNLSGSFRSEKRLLRKLYPASTNFLSLAVEPIPLGFKVEAYTAMVLKEKIKSLFLYRHRQKEIDFLIPEKKVAIEVKYQHHLHPSDYRYLLNFIREKKYEKGIIITRNKEQIIREKNIISIPLENLEALKF